MTLAHLLATGGCIRIGTAIKELVLHFSKGYLICCSFSHMFGQTSSGMVKDIEPKHGKWEFRTMLAVAPASARMIRILTATIG